MWQSARRQWPILDLRVAYFGQHPWVGTGPFPSRVMVSGPF